MSSRGQLKILDAQHLQPQFVLPKHLGLDEYIRLQKRFWTIQTNQVQQKQQEKGQNKDFYYLKLEKGR